MIWSAENFVVAIMTPTPRYWTPYRSASAPYGITVSGQFYSTRRVDCKEWGVQALAAPPTLELKFGDADNTVIDLVTNATNRRAVINIRKLTFDTGWNIVSNVLWFTGKTGKPAFEGEIVTLECTANFGRRGKSPSVQSVSLMTSHTPPAEGSKQTWFVGGRA